MSTALMKPKAGPAHVSMSKSMAHALKCQRYGAHQHFSPALKLVQIGALGVTGSTFHQYRSEYVNHLVDIKESSDPPWLESFIARTPMTDETRDLLRWDAQRFVIDPDLVVATELFLSVTADWQPLDYVASTTPQAIAASPGSIVHGTLDLVMLDGDELDIVDMKSGWKDAPADRFESLVYALLTLIHFPMVSKVRFVWDFVRFRNRSESLTYTRDDLDWMKETVQAEWVKANEIRGKFLRGEPLPVDPSAGLCPRCNLTCPIKESFALGIADFPPIQTLEDAETVLAKAYVANVVYQKGRDALRAWVDTRGPLALDNGFHAEMKASSSRVVTVQALLDILGIKVPDTTEKYDIPLGKLPVSSTELNRLANTRKRAGLSEELDVVADLKPRTSFDIKLRSSFDDAAAEVDAALGGE